MAKLPKVLVELLAPGVGTGLAGLKPAMTIGSGRIGHVLDGDPGGIAEGADLAQAADSDRAAHGRCGAVPVAVGLTVTALPTINGGRLMANCALAVGRGKQDIGVRSGAGVGGGKAFRAGSRRVLRERDGAGRTIDGQDRRPRRDASAGDGVPSGQPGEVNDVRDDGDPLVSVPVKTKAWCGPARDGMPVLASTLPSETLERR